MRRCRGFLGWVSFFCFFLLVILTITTAVMAEEPSATDQAPARKTWNLKNVDIHTVIDQLGKETHKNFIVSPQLNGKVTFVSSNSLTSDELYQAFLGLLQSNGFSAVQSGAVIKIVPDAYVREERSKYFDPAFTPSNEEMAVTVARVRFVSASELVKTLRQLVFHFGYIEAYLPTNDIIIADRAANIAKILGLIRRLDKPLASEVEVIHVHHSQAIEMVQNLAALLQQKGDAGGITLGADERSNNILVKGGTPEQRLQIRSLISQLDIKINSRSMNTEVIYLKYLRAEKAAVVLNGLIENYSQGKKGQIPSTGSAPPAAATDLKNSGQKDGLVNFSQSGMGNNGQGQQSNSDTSVDFSNMAQTQPKSGSVSPYVQWEESTNSVVVSAPKDLMQKLKSVLARLDIKRPQVLIEAVIAEVEADRAHELGIELNTGGKVQLLTRFATTLPLSGIGADNNIAISNPPTPDATGQGLSGTFFSGSNLRLLVRALESDSRSNILSTPNLVTLDNEPAQIKVGQRISFSIGQIQNNPTGGNPFNFFNQQDVGLILTINPQITPDGAIKLVIQQELSSILPGQFSAGSNPNLSERFIHTSVMAKNGDILVLGGLIQDDWQDVTTKVPILGDIPVFGLLFRDHVKRLTKQNLMIFLRPTILYDQEETVRIIGSKYDYLRHEQLKTRQASPPASMAYNPPILPPIYKKEDLPIPFTRAS